MKKIFLLLLFVLSCAHKIDKVQNTENDILENDNASGLKVYREVLDNGLIVLISQNRQLPIFTYQTFFDVGGRYESLGLTGATHFLEHMMFKGTTNNKEGVFDGTIERNGGRTNAYTSNDATVYYQDLPTKLLPEIIELESDRMANLALDKDSFERERLVILEERKMRYDNSPRGRLYLAMMEALFKNSPYGQSVIGTTEDISNLDRDQVYSFYKRFYAPNNAILVIAGDIDVGKTMKMIKSYYGKIPKSLDLDRYKAEKNQKEMYGFSGKYNVDVNVKSTNPVPMFMFAFKGVALDHEDAVALDILTSIIGAGSSSFLTEKYVHGKRPQLSSISFSSRNLRYSGYLSIYGELLKGVSLSEVKKSFKNDVRAICTNSDVFTQRNLQKIKNNALIEYYTGIMNNSGIASSIGNGEMFLQDYEYYKKYLARVNAIKMEEIQSVCKKYLKLENSVFISVWNKHK